jgi:hypothetical protein
LSSSPCAMYGSCKLSCVTERCGRVVDNPASYSGGSGLKSRRGYRPSWLTVFAVFHILSSPSTHHSLFDAI